MFTSPSRRPDDHCLSHRCRGLTMVEALVLMFVITFLLVAILLPMLGSARTGGTRRIASNSQLRGIHQAMVMYGQGNNGFFPGLDAFGQPTALDVEDRLAILINSNHLSPDLLVWPTDRAKQIWAAGPLTSDHYSAALLQVPISGGRYEEWHETLNHKAIVLVDRNVGTTNAPRSIHTPNSTNAGNTGDWRGGVAHNDNSVSFETTHLLATEYAGHDHTDDHLFEAMGDNDAYLVHSGN